MKGLLSHFLLKLPLQSLCLVLLLMTTQTGQPSNPERPWAFTPPSKHAIPQPLAHERIRNPIDAFILQKLEQNHLSLSPESSPRKLLRRLYFDLIGLPPTPEEMESFLQDPDPQAYEKRVDLLLNDIRHAERWARFWLDLARYGDTAGYEGDPDLPHAWRYRDYVIDSLHRDKPYNLFVKEQIAGDEFDEIMGAGQLPLPSAEQTVALTFLRLAPFTEPRGDETRHEMLSEMTSTVSSVFLGLTVGCAKCHDHKYDAISTRDFYRMKAFFSTVQIPPPERGDTYQIGGSYPAAFYRKGEASWAESKRKAIQEIQQEFSTLQTQLQERAGEKTQEKNFSLSTWVADPQNPLVSEKERLRYQTLEHQNRFAGQHLKRLLPQAMSLRHSFGPPYEPGVPVSRIMIRGEYDNPGEIVEAGFPSALAGHSNPTPIRLDPFKRWPTRSRRMALAEWIASPENPLTARVLVNRLWQHHFGQGIVSTPSDFGQLSGGPTHPELLDWLALHFIQEKWSLKSIHRLIVTSSTYRQESLPTLSTLDPDNRLLSFYPQRRLEAEAIRDTILFASGRLNPEPYGLPIFPPLPDGIEEQVKYSNSKWATDIGPDSRKRSLYIYQQRTLTMPFMQTFDGLVCEDTLPNRRTSITPLQALAMYNGDLTNQEAQHFAHRLKTQAGPTPQHRLHLAFNIALSRPPTPEETTDLLPYAADDKLLGLCRILFNTSEFIYVD